MAIPAQRSRDSFQVPSFNDWTANNPILHATPERSTFLWKAATEGVSIGLTGLFFGGCSHLFSTASFGTAGMFGLSYGLVSSLTSRVKGYFIGDDVGPVKKVISYIAEIGVNLMAAASLTNFLGCSITFLEGFKIYALSTVVAVSAVGVITLLFGAAIYNLFQSGQIQNFIDDLIATDQGQRGFADRV